MEGYERLEESLIAVDASGVVEEYVDFSVVDVELVLSGVVKEDEASFEVVDIVAVYVELVLSGVAIASLRYEWSG